MFHHHPHQQHHRHHYHHYLSPLLLLLIIIIIIIIIIFTIGLKGNKYHLGLLLLLLLSTCRLSSLHPKNLGFCCLKITKGLIGKWTD